MGISIHGCLMLIKVIVLQWGLEIVLILFSLNIQMKT